MIFKDDKKKIRKKGSDKKKEISESPIDFTSELFSLSISVEWKEQSVTLMNTFPDCHFLLIKWDTVRRISQFYSVD